MSGTPTRDLDPELVDRYERDGYLYLADALSPERLSRLREVFEGWVEESRSHDGPYGETFDGRPRFDVEPGHSAERPALRRIASPVEVSDAYLDVMRSNPALDAVAQLIGPNLRFRESKVNSKLPGTPTHLKFHQDLPFGPLTNEDLVTVIFHLDEVTAENGPLEVIPGSHRGPLYEHWHDGMFTGVVGSEVVEMARAEAVPCIGPAGSACLMHGRLLHGSGPNLSDSPRTLFISAYRSEDCYPLETSHVPSEHEGELVRGVRTNRVRCTPLEMAFSEVPTGASFFGQQAQEAS